MKNIVTLFIFIFSLQTMAGKVIKNPEIEFSASWMTITEIELTKEATIVRGALSYGSAIINNTILQDRDTGKEYKFLRVEGIKAYEQNQVDGTTCAIYFEPLDKTVKEFNYIEVDNNPIGNYYGIKLKTKEKEKPAVTALPASVNENWNFSNARYKYLWQPGKAQINIHIANIPKELRNMVPSVTLRYSDQITRKEENVLATIDENDCMTFDLDLRHPQWVYTSPVRDIFIIPGDTLDIYTRLDSSLDHRSPCPMKYASKGESAVISQFVPDFVNKYNMLEIDYNTLDKTVAEGKDATQPVLERWANQANEIIANEELRQALIHSPLSTFGKDIAMMSTVASKCIEIEDLISRYERTAYTFSTLEDGSYRRDENPNYVPLDFDKIYGTLMKNRDLIYNNPLALCEYSQWVFINRTLYNPLLVYYYEESFDEQGNLIGTNRVNRYGMEGTFMNDIRLSQSAIFQIEESLKNIKVGVVDEYKEAHHEWMANYIGGCLSEIQNPCVAQSVVQEYRKHVKATETGNVEDENKWNEKQNALWKKITEPYKGNTLFLDFWSMGCGPCRAGMIAQKRLVEAMKDEPCRFLYICNIHEKDKAEKWMNENEIKGEHVYIEPEEWSQLEAMINFRGIPRGVLVDKNGKMIESNFHIGSFNDDQLKELIKKF